MARPTKITPEAIELAEKLLSMRLQKGTIKRALTERFKFEERTAVRVLAYARENMTLAIAKPKTDHILDAYHFYEAMIRDKDARPGEKIKAQEAMCKLLGLDANFGPQDEQKEQLRIRLMPVNPPVEKS